MSIRELTHITSANHPPPSAEILGADVICVSQIADEKDLLTKLLCYSLFNVKKIFQTLNKKRQTLNMCADVICVSNICEFWVLT